MLLGIGAAARFIGVSISTLRRWELSQKLIPFFRTTGGHRRYNSIDLKIFMGDFSKMKNSKLTVAYARVSSHDQKADLERQIMRLENYLKKSHTNYIVIDDLGSGMNYKKKGLSKLLKLILSGQVSKLVLTHKDRLLRFGSELIFKICDYFGVEVDIVEEKNKLTDEQALAFDVLEIITVFSARMYGKRSHQNRKAVA